MDSLLAITARNLVSRLLLCLRPLLYLFRSSGKEPDWASEKMTENETQMGNTVVSRLWATAKQPTPMEMLGLEEYATLDEVKKAYCRKAHEFRRDSKKMLELNDTVDKAKNSLKVDLYTESLLATDFPKYASDFFERALLVYGLRTVPKFSDTDFQRFYSFWSRFRHEDKTIEEKVRKIVKAVKKLDPRIIEPASGEAIRRLVSEANLEKKKERKKEKVRKYWCEACKKGFQSENTLRDHLKSRQHRERAGNEAESGELQVGVLSPALDTKPKEKKAARRAEKEKAVRDSARSTEKCGEGGGNGGDSVNSYQSKEPALYRTCSRCNREFDSRSSLFMHIRNDHDSDSKEEGYGTPKSPSKNGL